MPRKLYEIAADIVESQASFLEMSPDSLEQALSTVFVTLQRMKLAEDGGFLLDQPKPAKEAHAEKAVLDDPKKSIQENKVICLECGAEMRQLTAKHLGGHGLTIRDNKKKWGFTQRQSLSAKSLSKARSKAAKESGLPEKLMQFQEERKRQEAEAAMIEGAEAGAVEVKPKRKAPAKRGRKKAE